MIEGMGLVFGVVIIPLLLFMLLAGEISVFRYIALVSDLPHVRFAVFWWPAIILLICGIWERGVLGGILIGVSILLFIPASLSASKDNRFFLC